MKYNANDINLVFLLLTLTDFANSTGVSIADFEQVNASSGN